MKSVIKENRIRLGMTMKDLADRVGVSEATVSRWESGNIANMRQNHIAGISEALCISPLLLLGFTEDSVNNVKSNPSNVHEYTFFDIGISAGTLENVEAILEDGDYDTMTLSDELMGKYAGRDSILILRVNGDSMNKIIPDKSYIAVDTTKTTVSDVSDKDIVVFSYDGEYSVKRYVHDKAGKRFLFKPESTYDTFSDIVITYENATDLRLIGKVVRYLVPLD